MMLRVSVETGEGSADLRAVTGGVEASESRVPNGDVLIAFAEAVVGRHAEPIERSRRDLVSRLGPEALVDSAGVVANFERMARIADATGIPLDAPMAAMTADIREQLGIDAFEGARNTPPPGAIGSALGRAGRALGLAGVRAASAFSRRGDSKKAER